MRFKFEVLAAAICAVSVVGRALAQDAPAAENVQTSIFVSPTGDDGNAGTSDKPIRTLQHARDLVRQSNQNMAGDIVVWLGDGTYRLDEPLVLESQDSGNNGHTVVFAALQGAHPIIAGSVQVTNWKQIDPAKNLWSATAPDALKNTRQLYIDGVRAHRTIGRLPTALTKTETGFNAESDVMSQWRNPQDIEFVFTGGNALWSEGSTGLGAWTEPRCPVASISGTQIVMAQPCWDNSTKRVGLADKFNSTRTANLVGPASVGRTPMSVENAYELLGRPGEFYLDRSAGIVYYTPRDGEDLTKADVEAPVLEKLVWGRGTSDKPVHDVAFRGIQFSYATWLYPSTDEGFSEIQANYMVTGPRGWAVQALGDLAPGGTYPYGSWTPTPGNVLFVYDRRIQFVRDAFCHLGAAGLNLADGSQNDLVEGCNFTDISGNGLALGNVDQPEADADHLTSDNKIVDNYFHEIPVEFRGGVGIDVGYAQRTLVQHNQLDHMAYTAISIGWGGWPDKIKLPGLANNSQNNVISNNLIFDHLLLLADGGGIYTQGLTGPDLANGEKVAGNVIYDQFGSGHAIYSDNGSANMTITGNIVCNTNFDNWGTAHANYYDGGDGSTRDWFDIEDNYWQQGTPDSVRDNVTMKNNHMIASLDQVPAEIVKNAGLEDAYADLLLQHFSVNSPPEAPHRISVAPAGQGAVVVAWNPPIYQGTAPVDSYTVTASTGQTATISDKDFQTRGYVLLTGLDAQQPATFVVTAHNSIGSSPNSIPSAAVTPKSRRSGPPGAPGVQAVFAGQGMASIHFSAPDETGESPVIAYLITASPGGLQYTVSGRGPLTLSGRHSSFFVADGLAAGKTYVFEVSAVNTAGKGPAVKSRAITVK
jgi:Right handed beta helix region/Fibronectin type III domain